MDIIEHFRRMHGCDVSASRAALDSLDSVPESNRTAAGGVGGLHAAYARGLGVMAHVHIARRVWHERIHGRVLKPSDWFPAWPTADTRIEAGRVDALWDAYLNSLAADELEREIRYEASDGSRFASVIRDVLTHVFNHATYHRGQVARIVTECGGTRAATDIIVFTRRAI